MCTTSVWAVARRDRLRPLASHPEARVSSQGSSFDSYFGLFMFRTSLWRANGIVTEASQEFATWIGRSMHDGGHFTWAAPGLPDQGSGQLRIN